ncbi:MAG: vitamin B12 dependent methionine synthase [Candidatus Atribacteria bacterium]|nr:vitamin B12 dependent methionine synthase [Candidatus Atribacteria bacterium]
MEQRILENITFKVDRRKLFETYHIEEGSDDSKRIDHLIIEAEKIAKPKAIYKLSTIDEKTENTVFIDKMKFTSRVLRVNLDEVHRAFPFIVTCGMELEEWSLKITEMMEQFWVDSMKEQAVLQAYQAVQNELENRYHLGITSTMNPGSLEDWPVKEQVPLFSLFGDPKKLIGVTLTDSFLMVPIKSVSGIIFPTNGQFESCQLCPRKNCPGRRAPFDPGLGESKYRFSHG